MRKKLNQSICKLFVLLLVLCATSSHADQKLKFIETTGRAVITDENSLDSARRNALEDAIFLAALHGGAKIDGYSSVDRETTLTDHFTLRPAGQLLDFNIVSETIEGDHYETVIRAAVGELNSTQCSARSKVKIIKFAGQLNFSTKTPSWLREVAKEIEIEISNLLQDYSELDVLEVSPTQLKVAELIATNDSFDYTSLTSGRVRVKSGDFALVPNISMDLSKSTKNIETEVFLSLTVSSKLFQGDEYSLVADPSYQLLIKLHSETPWRSFDMIGKKSRDQIKRSIKGGLKNHVSDLIKSIKCIPLTAKLKLRSGKLVVDLGHSHGLSTNSLAVSSGTNTPYSLLHVTETFENEATLEPLNKSLETSSLVGKTINFMETYK